MGKVAKTAGGSGTVDDERPQQAHGNSAQEADLSQIARSRLAAIQGVDPSARPPVHPPVEAQSRPVVGQPLNKPHTEMPPAPVTGPVPRTTKERLAAIKAKRKAKQRHSGTAPPVTATTAGRDSVPSEGANEAQDKIRQRKEFATATAQGKSRHTAEPERVSSPGSGSATGAKVQAPRQLGRESAGATRAGIFIELEKRARAAETALALHYVIANDTRDIVAYRQAFVLARKGRADFKTVAISSLPVIDRNVPLVRWIETCAKRLARDCDLSEPQEFLASAYSDERIVEARTYPFSHFLWVPLVNPAKETVLGGMLLARETLWPRDEVVLARSLGEVYGHAWSAFTTRRGSVAKKLARRSVVLGVMAIAAIAGFIPVSLTTLAPVEVVAADPVIVSAPNDGVIDKVLVPPNSVVKTGDILFRYVDTALRNEFKLAERNLLVASSRYRKFVQGSFVDSDSKREIALARAEVELSAAQKDYAGDLLARVEVKAQMDGVLIYSEAEEWAGRPVATGERVMQVADPNRIEFRIDLAVEDAITLANGSRVKIFLDVDPLDPLEAVLTSANYQATKTRQNTLAFRVLARARDEDAMVPRIGLRGTAQIYGETVSLYFFLFRRPLSAIRQFLGV